jgi:ATP-dependent Clp protease ATP-binding subunit ClpC
LPQRGRPQFGEILLPATRGEREILELALAEATSRNTEYVGTEHLLLALLREPDSAAGQVFSRHGFTYEAAAEQLRAVLAGER